MADSWTQSLIITHPKKGILQLFQNYRTVSLISHLEQAQNQAEGIIAEEQVGFPAGRSTTEQIFNLRILWKVPSTLAEVVPCLHRFQKGIWQRKACSLMCHHAEIQYQCKSYFCTTMLLVQSRWKGANENGSEQFWSKELCLMLQKNMMERLA